MAAETEIQQPVASKQALPVARIRKFFRGVAAFLKQMAQRPLSFAGFVVVVLFIVIALIGPALAPYRFDQILRDEDRRSLKNLPPSPEYILGTDQLGRDVFSRILWGARDTLGLPAVATIISVFLGTCLGLLTGYAGGWIDEILSRIFDSLLSIPALLLALVMIATIVPALNALNSPIINAFGANNISLTIVIILLYIPIVMRVIRSATLNLRDSGFIEAARIRGESPIYIMFREILPGVMPALIVEASLRLSYAIFLVASLGFLGLGVQPPSPEWGRMVLDARNQIRMAPWQLWSPVTAIAILIISVNLMSDGLRRVLRSE